jgi:predicted dehydrogenase
VILKIGIIGCGRIGCGFDDIDDGKIKTHAGSYHINSKTKIVSFSDLDKKKLLKYGKKYNVDNTYQNSSEMLKNENLDAVSICTHADSHLKLVEESIKNNVKGIFLEKPISNNLKNAQKIIEICKENKVILSINHRRRFDPFFHSINKFLKTKKIGKIQLINIYYGGGVANTCSHIFDVLRMFFGEVLEVEAKLSKNLSGNKSDPNLDISLNFKNKINCNLFGLDTRNYGVLEMIIFGTNGKIKFDLESNQVNYFKIDDSNHIVYKKLISSPLKLKHSKITSMSLGVNDFVNSIILNKNPMSEGVDAYKSLELIIASMLSANKKKAITIPLDNNNYNIKSN